MQNNNQKREEILKSLNWRYATKVFDTNKKIITPIKISTNSISE